MKVDPDGDVNTPDVDAVYLKKLYSDTFSVDGKETAYFDGLGNMIGKSYEFTDKWSGEKITSFETIDADGMHEWAGDIRIRYENGEAVSKEVFSSVEVDGSEPEMALDYTDAAGDAQVYTDTYRVEIASEYSFKGGSWVLDSSHDFYFDANWNLLKGTETESDGSQREYGQSWALKGETFEVGDLSGTAANATVLVGSLGLSVADFLDVPDATLVFKKVEVADWDLSFTETYYLNDKGEVLLKASGWSDAGDGNTAESITFSSAEGDWLGNVNSSSYTDNGQINYWSNAHVEIQTNWDGKGGYTEYSFDSDRAPDQGTGGFEANRIFNFDANGKLQNGVETENGVDYKIDANFGRSVFVDPTKLSQFAKTADDFEMVGIPLPPEVFGVDTDGSPSGVDVYYMQLTREDTGMGTATGNKEYSFMDATGAQIGKAFVWSDGNFESWNFDGVDAQGGFKWIGGTDLEYEDSGETRTLIGKNERTYEDLSSTDTPIAYTQDGQIKDYIGDYSRETSADYNWDVESSSWIISSHDFYQDNSGNLLKGTEVRDGVTTTYGFGWEIEGESVDFKNLGEPVRADEVVIFAKLGQTVSTLFGVADNTSVFTKTEEMPWDENSVEITYIGDDGKVIGYANRFSYSDDQSALGDGTQDYVGENAATQSTIIGGGGISASSSSTSYYSADGDWLGEKTTSTNPDGSTWESARFELQNVNGTRTELSYQSDGTSTRESAFNFDVNGAFTGGTETENGVNYVLDGDYNRKVSVDVSELTPLTTGIDDIPDALKVDTDSDGTVDTVYMQVLRDDTQDGGGKEAAYFDSSNNMIGLSFENTSNFGQSVEKFTNFEIINATGQREYAGNIAIRYAGDTAVSKKVSSKVETDGSLTQLNYVDQDGVEEIFIGKYILEVEKGFSTSDGGVSWNIDNSSEYYFDTYQNLLKGTEVRDGDTVTYGYNFEVLDRSVSIPDKAISIDPTAIIVESGLNIYLSDILDFGGDEKAAVKSEDFVPDQFENKGTENYFIQDGVGGYKFAGSKFVFDYSIAQDGSATGGPRGVEYFDSNSQFVGRIEYFDHDQDPITPDVVRSLEMRIETSETAWREIDIYQSSDGFKEVEDIRFSENLDGTVDVVSFSQDINTDTDQVLAWETLNAKVTFDDNENLKTFDGKFIDVTAGIEITLKGIDDQGEPIALGMTEYTGLDSPDDNGKNSFFDLFPVNNIGVEQDYIDQTGLSADNIRASVYWDLFGEKLSSDYDHPEVTPEPVLGDDGGLIGVQFVGAKFAQQWFGNLDAVMSNETEIVGFMGTATSVKVLLVEGRMDGQDDVQIGGASELSIDVGAIFELMSSAYGKVTPPVGDELKDMPDIKTVSVLASAGGVVDVDNDGNLLEWLLDTPPVNEGTIKLVASDPLFSLFGLNDNAADPSYPQKLLVEIGNAVDTSESGAINNSLVLQIIEDLNGNGSYDVGENLIKASFDIERTGDGQQEVWEAKAGGVLTLNIASVSGTTAQLTLTNTDSDQMVFDDTNDGTLVPDSWISKLSSAKSTIESDSLLGGLVFPDVAAGDDYIVKLSMLDVSNNVSVDILSLNIDVI